MNVAKRDQLRARFMQDYRPATTIDEIRCRELADIAERLSTLKKGSSEYVRLVQTMASLDAALRESRSIQQPPDFASLSTDELISRLETLLAAARESQRKPEPVSAEPLAASEDKRIVPVLLDLTPLPKRLDEHQWINLRGLMHRHQKRVYYKEYGGRVGAPPSAGRQYIDPTYEAGLQLRVELFRLLA